jgi:translation initiation factor 2B subunit (eIF-2B alpha/beta/delta family)
LLSEYQDVTADSTERLVQQIRDDREHGASELARQCLSGLAEYARTANIQDARDLKNRLLELAQRLQQSRPTMAPITNLINRWLQALQAASDGKGDVLRAQAAEQAEALIEQSKQAVATAARRAADLIGPDKTIITHSLSSTVVSVFELLGSRARAIITESRPPGEGRLLAEKLSFLGIATDFISDQQMGLFVQHADVALVGADTIANDGSVINKAGTYLLALAARDRGIPFYVCFESFKYSELDASTIPLEHHDPAELDAPRLTNIKPHNIYFDITPPRLISTWVTERGAYSEAAVLVAG